MCFFVWFLQLITSRSLGRICLIDVWTFSSSIVVRGKCAVLKCGRGWECKLAAILYAAVFVRSMLTVKVLDEYAFDWHSWWYSSGDL